MANTAIDEVFHLLRCRDPVIQHCAVETHGQAGVVDSFDSGPEVEFLFDPHQATADRRVVVTDGDADKSETLISPMLELLVAVLDENAVCLQINQRESVRLHFPQVITDQFWEEQWFTLPGQKDADQPVACVADHVAGSAEAAPIHVQSAGRRSRHFADAVRTVGVASGCANDDGEGVRLH